MKNVIGGREDITAINSAVVVFMVFTVIGYSGDGSIFWISEIM